MNHSGKHNPPLPRIDELLETAPPWTLPHVPGYALDPWLARIPSAAVNPRALA